MRYVILDTETTGFEPELGHKLVEIGAVEMIDRQLTGRHFHHYLNPQRDSDEGALAVHGLTTEFLSDKPLFKTIADDLLEFIDGATVLIHNAAFDTKFINAELAAIQRAPMETICAVEDTLHMARQMFPGKRNNLDALCERLGVSNAHRVLHGALLDAEILAEVYLAMTRGQETLSIDIHHGSTENASGVVLDVRQLAVIYAVDRSSAKNNYGFIYQIFRLRSCFYPQSPLDCAP